MEVFKVLSIIVNSNIESLAGRKENSEVHQRFKVTMNGMDGSISQGSSC